MRSMVIDAESPLLGVTASPVITICTVSEAFALKVTESMSGMPADTILAAVVMTDPFLRASAAPSSVSAVVRRMKLTR